MLNLASFDVCSLARGAEIHGRSLAANFSAGLAVCAGITAAIAFLNGGVAWQSGSSLSAPENPDGLGLVTTVVVLSWACIRARLWLRRAAFTPRTSRIVTILELEGAALLISTAYFGT